LWRVVDRIHNGHGKPADIDLLNSVADNIQGRTICALGDAAAMPVRAFVKVYRDEFLHHIANKCCIVHPGGYSTEHPHTPVSNVVAHQLAAD
ncbi:MAG: NADH-ubiquinone oxidoreductase-F iron-sulfur binding region domain-containing protein, partial [Burkholderiales bacterium]